MPTSVIKVAQVTAAFWILKICATTLGETAGDLVSMTLNVGYAMSSLALLAVFAVTLGFQLSAKRFYPVLYWLVILSTSTAGTTLSDFMDRTLKFGYTLGATILVCLLGASLLVWRLVEGNLSVDKIQTRRAECFYWITILISNTLGTALGDYLADTSGLGFFGGAAVIGGAILLVALAGRFTKFSKVTLFWIAFVLTRPFGATFGDLLTKPTEKGGLAFGTTGSSLVLLAILVITLIITMRRDQRAQAATS